MAVHFRWLRKAKPPQKTLGYFMGRLLKIAGRGQEPPPPIYTPASNNSPLHPTTLDVYPPEEKMMQKKTDRP